MSYTVHIQYFNWVFIIKGLKIIILIKQLKTGIDYFFLLSPIDQNPQIQSRSRTMLVYIIGSFKFSFAKYISKHIFESQLWLSNPYLKKNLHTYYAIIKTSNSWTGWCTTLGMEFCNCRGGGTGYMKGS